MLHSCNTELQFIPGQEVCEAYLNQLLGPKGLYLIKVIESN